jgi:hypothetical protein
MTVLFFTDGYRDLPPRNNPRAVLAHELRRLGMLHWGDPSDVDLLDRITLKAELDALDREGTS